MNQYVRMSIMKITPTKALLLLSSLWLTLLILRGYLYFYPGTNLNFGQYNIHHLFTGIVMVVVAAVPLGLNGCGGGDGRGKLNENLSSILVILLGIGASLVLDEWVYLIATDGSDSAYWLPVSVIGALIAHLLLTGYLLVLTLLQAKTHPE